MSIDPQLRPGLYDRLIDGSLARRLKGLAPGVARVEDVRDPDLLRERLIDAVRRELADVLDADSEPLSEDGCLELIDGLLRHCRKGEPESTEIPRPARRLTGVLPRSGALGQLPSSGLHGSFLFTAGKATPSLLAELRTELESVDRVDILVSFITWSGVRKLQDVLSAITAVGADGIPKTTLRVLTTTYCGNTERRAVDWLARLPGVEVRISLDGSRTRLHAKAWILRRESGFGSAYVGSANLSGAALTGGLEWTVKFTQVGDAALFDRAGAHFETLWNDSEFQSYDPNEPEQVAALDRALKRESGSESGAAITWLGIEPRPFQIELLDRLEAERRHGRFRNLLVAATGTGKTVVAAFDYRRRCEAEGGRPRLLFVAHRKEILVQSRRVYAGVLHEPDFGTILADGDDAGAYDHCFATIQSINSKALLDRCGPKFWDVVVVDECHHAAAVSYDEFLKRIQPTILLGLTATPERADGKNILALFDSRPDGSPAAELRLWQALDQELLCPFEYYGCADDTDLSGVPWGKSADERVALENLLNANHARALVALDAYRSRVSDPKKARALGFCVSVAHAEFMADQFCRAGIPAEAVSGQTVSDVRRGAPARLDRREVNVLFTCDLYNEGIDIPRVDTLLFLRPTQSPVLFQQQLGRGLRRADQKDSCLVVDLVGRHREDFRFDRLLGVLSGLPRMQILEQVEHGFSSLPPGCHIQLDRISRERVLESLKAATKHRWTHLARELAAYAALDGKSNPRLRAFIGEQGIDLASVYPSRQTGVSGWTALRREAGVLRGEPEPNEIGIGRELPGLLHHEDPKWLTYVSSVAEGRVDYRAVSSVDRRRLDMLAGELFPGRKSACTGEELLGRLAQAPIIRSELAELVALLDESSDLADLPLPGVPSDWPLQLHARYTLRELMMASGNISGRERTVPMTGVLALPKSRVEFLFVTLDKSSGFSSRTAYHDYAISPTEFHWQSQNSCGPTTTAGRRYLYGAAEGWVFQLFVRETKSDAYRALGPVSLIHSEGERPMSITWHLQVPMTAALFRRYSILRTA